MGFVCFGQKPSVPDKSSTDQANALGETQCVPVVPVVPPVPPLPPPPVPGDVFELPWLLPPPDTPALMTAALGVLSGRRLTAYPALEPDMQAAGAAFQDSEAVVDGVLVSSRAWPDHPAWMREFLAVLREKAPVT